jgi:RNA polymerase-binding transcription factor DksA
MSATPQKSRRSKGKTATKDVIGDPQGEERIRPKWRKEYRRLLALHERLLGLHGDLNKDALEERPAFSLHMGDAGTDSFERDLALGVLSHEQDAIYEIEEALGRIRNGTYGICELTGRKISPQRLEAVPWTRFSAEAEKTLEKRGRIKRPRLGRATRGEGTRNPLPGGPRP